MTKIHWLLVSALLWVTLWVPPIANAVEEAAPVQPPTPSATASTQWRYFWHAREDGTTEVWRQAQSNAAQANASWQAVALIPARVIELVAAPAQPAIVYARSDAALFRSLDAGQSWERLTTLPDTPTALAVGNPTSRLIYLGTRTGGVYRSLDGGNTWRGLGAGMGLLPGAPLEITALALHPSDERIVYAAAAYWLGTTQRRLSPVGVFLSVDGGDTWLPAHRAHPGEPLVTKLTGDAARPLTVQAVSGTGAAWYTFDDRALLDAWLVADSPARRAAAAKTWGLLGGEAARERLLERLALEPDPAVGQAVAQALATLVGPQTAPTLIELLGHDEPQVRWRAATVLGSIPTDASIEALAQTMLNDHSIARQAAARSLGRIGGAQAAAAVIPLLDEIELTTVRHLALSVLEQIGEPAVDPLIAALAHEWPARRQHAAEALGWIGAPEATLALAEALHDPSEAVRIEAAWALGKIGTMQAREALAVALTDPSPLVRAQAEAALAGQSQEAIAAAVESQPTSTQPSIGLWTWLPWSLLALAAILVAVFLLSGRGGQRPRPSARS
jgi:HEAT repeat protein